MRLAIIAYNGDMRIITERLLITKIVFRGGLYDNSLPYRDDL